MTCQTTVNTILAASVFKMYISTLVKDLTAEAWETAGHLK